MNLAAVLLFAINAFAVEGNFSYKGSAQVETAIRYETVYPAAAAGKLRLQELLNEGYQCASKLQFVQCHLIVNDTSIDLTQLDIPQSLLFNPMGPTDNETVGTDVKTYDVNQSILVDNKYYELGHYIENGDLIKVSVGSLDKGDYYSFVATPDALTYIFEKTKTESQWIYTRYWIGAEYSRD